MTAPSRMHVGLQQLAFAYTDEILEARKNFMSPFFSFLLELHVAAPFPPPFFSIFFFSWPFSFTVLAQGH